MTSPTLPPVMLLLAQTAKPVPTTVLIWVGILIACAVIGGMLLVLLRKKMFDKQSAMDVRGSLMDHLRDAHVRGDVSTEEYEQTRKSMASRMSHVLDTKRAGGLFELPDPKRPTKRPVSKVGAPFEEADALPGTVPRPETSDLRAPPGYDLTGQPLPPPPKPK